MSLESRLAAELLRTRPERAAAVLEQLGREESLRVLSAADARAAGAVLRRMAPQAAAAVLDAMPPEKGGPILQALPLDAGSRLARRIAPERAEALFERLPPRTARALRSLQRFPEDTAGALMDADVLALSEDLTVKEAFLQVRETPESARYNVYVIDRDQKLVGAVNLRELFLAPPRSRLADLMVRDPLRISARADRGAVLSHPGWREVHSLPVIDEDGAYLGAIRYRTLRQLEDELLRGRGMDSDVQQALGQLFAAGAGGLLDALAGSVDRGAR